MCGALSLHDQIIRKERCAETALQVRSDEFVDDARAGYCPCENRLHVREGCDVLSLSLEIQCFFIVVVE